MSFRHRMSGFPAFTFGIRARLIGLVLALLLPFLAYLLYAAKTEEKLARDSALQGTLVFARLYSARIDDQVSQIGQLLNTLGHAVTFNPAAAASNDKFLRSLKNSLPRYINDLAIWMPDGSNIGNLSPVADRAKLNVANWHFFREALKKSGWTADGPFSATDSREFNMMFTQAVTDDRGNVAGVVSASMKLSEFRSVLGRDTTLPADTVTTLLDAQGIVLARSLNPEIWIGETLIGTKAIAQALKQHEGSFTFQAEDGVARLAGFSTASYVPWTVYIGTPTEVALAPVNQRLRERLVVGSAVLLGLLLIALFLGERISKPLRQLAADAKTFGEGALDHRTRVKAGGETGVLAATLNQMAAAIQARTSALSASEGEARRAEQALKESEARLRHSETRLRTIIESEPECVMVLGKNGRVLEINAAGLKLIEAQSLDEIKDRDVTILAPEYRNDLELMHQRVLGGETVNFDFEIVSFKGTRRWINCVAAPLPNEQGQVIGQLAIARDITERKQAADRIEHLATRDALTDLPNRALLGDRLSQVLARAHREGTSFALMFIDLDRFKTINDSLGHHAGDALLRETALRLTQCLREQDTVARQGGDEFIVLLPESDGPAATLVARKILDAITQPLQFEGRELVVQASIGIAMHPQHGGDATTLLRNADVAMYHAKEAGRNNYQFFQSQMSDAAQSRLAIESALRRAIASNELRLHYQPQVRVASGEIAGYEALFRWAHPERGLLMPSDFLSIAEESGLIVPLGEWTLHKGCEQAAQWQHGGKRWRLAINISARQVRAGNFTDAVLRVLTDTGCDPGLLELEMTEDTITRQYAAVTQAMQVLQPLGIGLCVNGFGSSYASLVHLKRLPIDKVKIDRSFIHNIDDPHNAAIVRATIQLGHNLSLQVAADGVETPAQLEFLRAAGCDLAQGYHLGAPAPLATQEEMAQANLPLRAAL